MGATFSRLKNWVAEILTYSDLNQEIDNILNNLDPSGAGDYSTNTAQMQTTTDPGEVGTESLATSLAGELERLRFAIQEIKGAGAAQWYSTVGTSLTELINVLGNSLADNRIASGKTSANSSRLVALDPSGSTLAVTLDGSPTPLVYYIGGTQYSIDADVTASGLSGAPSTNNTCLINDLTFADDQFTQFLGEYGTGIPVDNMGSEITALVGRYAGFKIENGSATEYMLAYVESTTRLSRAQRGCFVNSSQTAVPRIPFTDNDTITLLRTAWVFGTTTSTLAVTYNIPTYSAAQPTSPTTGDYWFDLANSAWMYYNSSAWVSANATLIGVVMSDATACVAAMMLDAANNADPLNTMQVSRTSNSIVSLRNAFSQINVAGSLVKLGRAPLTWDMTANLEAGVTEAANTFYYIYVKESGAPLISNKVPTDRRGDLGGLYHPEELWRCIAVIKNDGSSNLDAGTLYEFGDEDERTAQFAAAQNPNCFSLTATVAGNDLTVRLLDRIGNYPSDLIPVVIPVKNVTATTGTAPLLRIRERLSITAANGASLGHTNAKAEYVWVSVVDDAGTPRLALSGRVPYDNVRQSSTTISSGATSGTTLYASAGSTNTAVRLIAQLSSTQTTAGMWASAISDITLWPTVRINRTEPVTYVPTISAGFGTLASSRVQTWRDGAWLHGQGYFQAGTCSGNAATMNLGFNGTDGNVTIDVAIFNSQAQTVGTYSTNGNAQAGTVIFDGASTGIIAFATTYATPESQIVTANANGICPNSGFMTFSFRVPVLGWSTYGP